MTAKPLKKEIFEQAKKLEVTDIYLRFSGGNDEGYLDIEVAPQKYSDDIRELIEKIEEWAWDVYAYSGAGGGNDYGDTIQYDLENSAVFTSEWHTVCQHSEPSLTTLKICT
jgi:hypothetical protein